MSANNNYIYVLVKHEGVYSCQDWCIKGVYDKLYDSQVAGWSSLVDECLRDYKLKFYKNRSAEFAKAIGISEYHIEEWYPAESKKGRIWYIGFDNKNHYVDKFIKDTEVLTKNCEGMLNEWKNDLNKNKIPKAMRGMTILDLETHEIKL